MVRTAGCGRDIDIEDVDWRTANCDGDALYFKKIVVGFGGEVSETDGVMYQEGQSTTRITEAVFADKVVTFEGWDGRFWV